MRIIDITHPPKDLWIGRESENKFRPIAFECANWFETYPNATIVAYYQPYASSDPYPLVLSVDGTKRIWHPIATELVKGNGELQIVLMLGDVVGTSAIIPTRVDRSLISSADHPAEDAPSWTVQVVEDVTEQADRAEEAASHYPKIVNGIWYVWSVQAEDFVFTGIEAQGEDGYSPTVTVTEIEGGHRVTITDADGAHTFDVMDGDNNAVLYTAQTLTDSQKAQARTNVGAGTYSKPSGGIPASDLASGVIPSVPQMATHADMSDWTSGKTVDAATLKTDFNLALLDLDDLHVNKADKTELPDASTSTPVTDGAAAVGTSTDYARADHVHPSDTTRLATTGNAYRSASIPMGHLDSTSTATVMTATVDGITELRDGVCMWLHNGVITSASGFTLNVNGLGAKPCYSSLAAASRSTTIFNVNYALLMIYNSTRVEGGCWDIVYGIDTNTTYTPPKLGFGYAVCTTAAATAAKTASISSYALTTGGIVSIHFDNDVPSGATLNVSSKGAKAMYYRGAAITDGVIKAGDTATFIYSTYYHLIAIDRDDVGDALPSVTASDNGKFLRVVSGAWAAETVQTWQGGSY